MSDLDDARDVAEIYLRCVCPRDPDDEDDPGDPLSDCPVHGWSWNETPDATVTRQA